MKRTLLNAVAAGGLALLAGCASVDRTNFGSTGVFQNQTNSTRMARSLTRAYDVAEKVMEDGAFTEGTIRYCKVEDVPEELEALGVNGRAFTELYEGQTIQIGWDDPSTPKTPDYLEPPQRISGDGTAGSRVGNVKATENRADVEAELNRRAQEQGIEERAVVYNVNLPMAEVADAFLGTVEYVGQYGGEVISGTLPLPQFGDLHRIVKTTGVADNAPYIMVNMEVRGNPEVTRLISVAPTEDVFFNKYTVDLAHDDTVYAVAGGNDTNDFITMLDTTGRIFNSVNGTAAEIRQADEHRHYFRHRGLYLPSEQSGLDKAVEKTGQVGALIGNVQGIQGAVAGE